MSGSDLLCRCGSRAVDVAPDFDCDLFSTAILWTCTSGHRQIIGLRPTTGHVETLTLPDTETGTEPKK